MVQELAKRDGKIGLGINVDLINFYVIGRVRSAREETERTK